VAIEWLGVILLVVVIALTLIRVAPSIGTQIACGVRHQIETLGGGSAEDCGKVAARSAAGSSVQRTPFGAPDRPRDTARKRPRGAAPKRSRARTPSWARQRSFDSAERQLQLSAITKACKVAGLVGAGAVKVLEEAGLPSGAAKVAREVIAVVCDFEGKAENEFVKQLQKVLAPICRKGFNICKKTINAFCKVAGGKVCRLLKKAACFVSDLDIFCTASQKKEKAALSRARRIAARKLALRSKNGFYKVAGGRGSSRYLKRDARDRATAARGRVNGDTVRYRRGKGKREKRATVKSKEVTGFKKGCKFDRGHLLAGSLGGSPSDPRNFVPLPRGFNRGLMASKEKLIAKAAREGRDLFVKVTPYYRVGEAVPYRVDITVKQRSGPKGSAPFDRRFQLPVPRPPAKCL